MELSIIIVNYKCKEKTINCIDKIYQSNLENINFEIILVDNNSDDKILDIVKDKYSQVIFIQTEKNLGMGGGNNVGIKIAKGDYVLILNPDTAPENTAIKKMLFDLKTDQSIGLIGPKLLYPDGK
ncbi:MAG: glycosyltransferase, partial [Candidatus Falkowbacteria bacterium]|nr:glycosyltransferase [Candidatus Falkowbacteria bacterium]